MSDTPVYGFGSAKENRSPHRGPNSKIAAGEGLVRLESHRYGNKIVVTVAGEIDLLVADRLRKTLMEQVSARPEVLVVDLDEVRFFGSTGLTALALTQRAASEGGVDLRVVATNRSTLRPLQITGMTDELAIYASRRDALADGSGGGQTPGWPPVPH